MNLGVFMLVKNEANWLPYHLLSFKDVVSEWCFYDGNSTDGTLEILEYMKSKYGLNIRVFKDKDPKDLQDDYARLFDECLNQLTTEYALFAHPDMVLVGGSKPDLSALAATVEMDHFGGDPGGPIFKFTEGRGRTWKIIMKRALGLHYFGHYGAQNEDMYFRDITGDSHILHNDLNLYPYEIEDSGLKIHHYSDVRPYRRRLGRMMSALKVQYPGSEESALKEMAVSHPRVCLSSSNPWPGFAFSEHSDIPNIFTKHCDEFAQVLGKPLEEVLWLPSLPVKVS